MQAVTDAQVMHACGCTAAVAFGACGNQKPLEPDIINWMLGLYKDGIRFAGKRNFVLQKQGSM